MHLRRGGLLVAVAVALPKLLVAVRENAATFQKSPPHNDLTPKAPPYRTAGGRLPGVALIAVSVGTKKALLSCDAISV
jgi:hypothetical protein